MKNKYVLSLIIVFLCSVLGYQMIDLINYLNSPKQARFDDKVEIPEIIDLDDQSQEPVVKNPVKPSKPDSAVQSKPTNSPNSNTTEEPKTKPTKKNQFLNVFSVAEDHFMFSKDDYEGQIAKKRATGLISMESNWEKKILESESLIEKSLLQAARGSKTSGQIMNTKLSQKPDEMERFGLKIELPIKDEGTKFKLQYREPPKFGQDDLPELDMPKTASKTGTFSIEKTTATESPWDNFSNPKNFP